MRAFYLFLNRTSGRRSTTRGGELPPIRPGAFARWAAMAELDDERRRVLRGAQGVGQAGSPSRAPETSRP